MLPRLLAPGSVLLYQARCAQGTVGILGAIGALLDTCNSKLVEAEDTHDEQQVEEVLLSLGRFVSCFLLAPLFLDDDVCKPDSRNSSVDWIQT